MANTESFELWPDLDYKQLITSEILGNRNERLV